MEEFLTQTKHDDTLNAEQTRFERFVLDYKDSKLTSYDTHAAGFFQVPKDGCA